MTNDSDKSIDRITFMLASDDARCDATLTPEKTYYRFLAEDSLEDGELPGLRDKFQEKMSGLLECFHLTPAVSSSIEPLRFRLFINNRQVEPETLNRTTLRSFIDKLSDLYYEFSIWQI